MPVAPYAAVRASINGGALTSGGITVAAADTVQLSGLDTSLWTSQRWELYAFPEGWTAPAGWSTDANGKFYSTAVTPPVFTIPATARWGKIAVRLTVNNGLFANAINAQMKDESTVFSQPSPTRALVDVFEGETNQFGTSHIIALQRNLRVLDGSGGGASLPSGCSALAAVQDVAAAGLTSDLALTANAFITLLRFTDAVAPSVDGIVSGGGAFRIVIIRPSAASVAIVDYTTSVSAAANQFETAVTLAATGAGGIWAYDPTSARWINLGHQF